MKQTIGNPVAKFRMLLRKDVRLNRLQLSSVLCANLGPYVGFIALSFLNHDRMPRHMPLNYYQLGVQWSSAAAMGLFFGAPAAAVYGGAAFTRERRERWSEFLAMMPIARWQVVLSKLLACVVPLVAFFYLHWYVLTGWGRWPMSHTFGYILSLQFDVFQCAACYIALFGTAWLFSTILESATIAGGVAICCVAGAILIGRSVIGLYVPSRFEDFSSHWAEIFAGVLGLLALVRGSFYYVRRIAP